jgi:ligand-binding sensor domain-containing protein
MRRRFIILVIISILLSACGNIISNNATLVITKTAIASFTLATNIISTTTLIPTIGSTETLTFTPTNDSSPCTNETYLNANYINRLSVDNNGYLWSASTGGIIRWDIKSNNYTIYTTKSELSLNNVTSIFVANDKSIWATSPNGKIHQYKNGIWKEHNVVELKPTMNVVDIVEDNYGNIWMSTYGAGVLRYDGKSWKTYLIEDGLASVFVYSLNIDKNGEIWAGTYPPCCDYIPRDNLHSQIKEGLSVFDGTKWRIIANKLSYGFWSDNERNIWFPEIDSWSYYDGKEIINIDKTQISELANGIYRIKTNIFDLYFIKTKNRYSEISKDIITQIGKYNREIYKDINSIVSLANGNTFIGTNTGIISITNNTITYLLVNDKYMTIPTYSLDKIMEERSGRVWIDTDMGILQLLKGDWIKTNAYKMPSDISLPTLRKIETGRIGNYQYKKITLISGEEWSIQNREVVYHYGDIENRFMDKFPTEITIDPSGNIWIVSLVFQENDENKDPLGYNFYKWDGSVWQLITYIPRGIIDHWVIKWALYNDYEQLIVGNNNEIWFNPVQYFDSNLGVFHYSNNTWSKLTTKEGLPSDNISLMYLNYRGDVWFASKEGIIKMCKKQK